MGRAGIQCGRQCGKQIETDIDHQSRLRTNNRAFVVDAFRCVSNLLISTTLLYSTTHDNNNTLKAPPLRCSSPSNNNDTVTTNMTMRFLLVITILVTYANANLFWHREKNAMWWQPHSDASGTRCYPHNSRPELRQFAQNYFETLNRT